MARKRKQSGRSFDCPHCGEAVRAGALACRACGSDLETGWAEDAQLDLGSLPESCDDFDYDAWLEREVGGATGATARRAWVPRLLALLVVLAMLIWLLRGW